MYKAIELFYYFFQGTLFFQVSALALFYLITKRKDSLFFMGFLLFASLNFFIAAPELFYNMKDEEVLSSRWFRFFNTPFAMLSGLFFSLFLREFFGDIVNDKRITRLLTWIIRIQLFLFIPFYILYFLHLPTEFIFNLVNFGGVAIGIWIVYIIFKNKIPYTKIVALGTVVYLIGSVLTTWLLILRLQNVNHILVDHFPFLTLKIGILVQSIFYLIAIFNKWHQQSIADRTNAILAERDRIAAELHDDVGATISGISLYSHLANLQLDTAPRHEIKASLHLIQQNAIDVVEKMKDIVWLNKAHTDSIYTLLKRLDEYLHLIAKAKNIYVDSSIPEDFKTFRLPENVGRNMYLIGKEAINNIIKHSNATSIKFEAKLPGDSFLIHLADNGIGYDPQKSSSGNGISNMKRRAEEIGAKFSLNSIIGQGSEVIISLPAKNFRV